MEIWRHGKEKIRGREKKRDGEGKRGGEKGKKLELQKGKKGKKRKRKERKGNEKIRDTEAEEVMVRQTRIYDY